MFIVTDWLYSLRIALNLFRVLLLVREAIVNMLKINYEKWGMSHNIITSCEE